MSSSPEQGLLTHRGTIYPWHCDHMGHMNVMWYVGKFDEATWHLCTACGITPQYMREGRKGMVAVDQRVAYVRELVAGDLISIRSVILEIKRSSLRFIHEMRNEATREVAAVTLLTGVHIDSVSRSSCPFPDEIRRSAQPLIATDRRWASWPPGE
jgi:acyl-CoA thioester hydrolase